MSVRSTEDGFADHPALATTLAVCVAFALIVMPGPKRDTREVVVAAALGLALIALSLCSRRIPRTTQLLVPLGYLAMADVLRASEGGSRSGYGGLFLLPVLWLAFTGRRRLLILGLVAMLTAEILPLVVIGAPQYPSSGWRATVVLTSVGALAGFTIQKLLNETRAQAIENADLYDEANRWSETLESLNVVGNALATETDLRRLLDLVAGQLRELLGARVVAVQLPNGADDELQLAAISGDGTADLIGETVSRSLWKSGLVLARGRSERVDSVADDPEIEHENGGHFDAHAGLWVPLIVRDQPIGVIAAYDKLGAPYFRFSDDDLRLAETFASRAAVAVDLSERVARDALRRVVAAQEVERRRFARELHDETGQALTSIMLGLKSVEETVVDPDARRSIAALGQQIAGTMQDVRRLALELRPKALDDFGLVTALERLTTTFEQQTGIVVDLEAGLSAQVRLPSETETALYRIVQEALTNMLKHAAPRRASVLLTPKERSLLLVVEDDGRGFDPAVSNGGLGLDGMRERVHLLNGTFQIESRREAGTTLVIEVPLR
jgi:signal transduction histidine kinase